MARAGRGFPQSTRFIRPVDEFGESIVAGSAEATASGDPVAVVFPATLAVGAAEATASGDDVVLRASATVVADGAEATASGDSVALPTTVVAGSAEAIASGDPVSVITGSGLAPGSAEATASGDDVGVVSGVTIQAGPAEATASGDSVTVVSSTQIAAGSAEATASGDPVAIPVTIVAGPANAVASGSPIVPLTIYTYTDPFTGAVLNPQWDAAESNFMAPALDGSFARVDPTEGFFDLTSLAVFGGSVLTMEALIDTAGTTEEPTHIYIDSDEPGVLQAWYGFGVIQVIGGAFANNEFDMDVGVLAGRYILRLHVDVDTATVTASLTEEGGPVVGLVSTPLDATGLAIMAGGGHAVFLGSDDLPATQKWDYFSVTSDFSDFSEPVIHLGGGTMNATAGVSGGGRLVTSVTPPVGPGAGRSASTITDPTTATTFTWPINPSEEDPLSFSRQYQSGARTTVGLSREQSANDPPRWRMQGTILDPAQKLAMDALYDACDDTTLEYTDFLGDAYEVVITVWDVRPERSIQNPVTRDLYVWRYTVEMEIVRAISGPLATTGVLV